MISIVNVKAGTSDEPTKILLKFLNRNRLLKIRRLTRHLKQNIKDFHAAERASIQVITVRIAHGVYNLR